MLNKTRRISSRIGLQTSDINIILENLEPDVKVFKKCQVILRTSNKDDILVLVLDGTAFLEGENETADKTIIEYFAKGELFGKRMFPHLEQSLFYVISKNLCTVAFISYHKLLEYCAANQSTTVHIMDYLFHGLERKALVHVYILQQRTLRGKILLYFNYLCKEYCENYFTLPMPFIDLADYLSVDRSALMREIKKLNNEGIIKSDRRKITLLVT